MVYDVFEAGAAAAPYVKYKREAFLRPGKVPVAFSLALVAKDQDLISDLAALTESRMDQAEASRRLVAEAGTPEWVTATLVRLPSFCVRCGTPAVIPAHLTPHFLSPELARPA